MTDRKKKSFEPKQPKTLSDEEKKIDSTERIAQQYKAKIPSFLKQIIFYLSNVDYCRNNKGVPNRCVLVHGNPSCRTNLIHIMANELQVPLISCEADLFVENCAETSNKIIEIFETANELNKPVIIYVDDIDRLAQRNRWKLIELLWTQERNRDNTNIIFVAGANNVKALDERIQAKFGGVICEIKDCQIQLGLDIVEFTSSPDNSSDIICDEIVSSEPDVDVMVLAKEARDSRKSRSEEVDIKVFGEFIEKYRPKK